MLRVMNRLVPLVLAFVVGIGASGGGGTALAQTPDVCTEAYAGAEEAYYAANFELAIDTLQTCLNRPGVSDSMRVRSYRLLSFVHLGRNDQAAARLAVESLLDLQPTYSPDPGRDRPDFVALVKEVKASRQPPTAQAEAENGRRWLRWVAAGVGAVALGTLAAVLFGGGDGDDPPEPLPPPDVPSQ